MIVEDGMVMELQVNGLDRAGFELRACVGGEPSQGMHNDISGDVALQLHPPRPVLHDLGTSRLIRIGCFGK